jgi:hypothetical protein
MLLFLTRSTFTDAAASILTDEVRLAMKNGIEIVLVHEVDLARDGCDFSHFFETTPIDLIDAGLYKTIAIAAHREPYRTVSLALVCKALGGAEKRAVMRRPRHAIGHAKKPSHKIVVMAATEQSASAADPADEQVSLEEVQSSPEAREAAVELKTFDVDVALDGL